MVIPKSNLPPGSQNWGTKMEQLLKETDSTISASESQLGALSKGQEATIGLLSEQISALNTQVGDLPLVQMYSINEKNIPGFTGSGTGNYFTAFSETYDFPEGKTTADVMVFGEVNLDGYTTGAQYYFTRVGVNSSYDLSSMIGNYIGSGVSIARVVSGPSFTVTAQVSATAGASVTEIFCYLTVMVCFK